MSLKAFHVGFVLVAILLTTGFGWWALREYQVTAETTDLLLSAASFGVALILVVYGVWFLRKYRRLGFL